MKQFSDGVKDWKLMINVSSLLRVRDQLGVNLGAIFADGEAIDRLFNDPLFVAEIAWCLVETQAAERDTTRDDFLSRLGGSKLQDLESAFWDELIAFFPPPKDEMARRLRDMIHDLRTEQASTVEQMTSSELFSNAQESSA